MIAIPWYFAQGDDMVRFGVIYTLTNVAALFWVPYSGALTDRYSRKKILMVLMGILGIIIIGIAGYGFGIAPLPWWMVAGVFSLTFLNFNIHYPTLYAFVHEMSDAAHYGRVTSLIEIQGQLSTILAGAGGALLLSGIGPEGIQIFGLTLPFLKNIQPWAIHEIFLLDGISYFLGVIILGFIPFVSGKHLHKSTMPVFQRVVQGIDFLRQNKYVAIFGFASYVVFMAVIIEGFYLLAPYVSGHLKQGPEVYAGGKMMYAFGAVLAGFVIQRLFRRLSLTDSIITLTTLGAVIFTSYFFNSYVGLYFGLAILLGLSNAGIRIQRVTYLFNKVPNAFYGRVSGTFNLGNIATRIVFISLFSLPFFQTDTAIRWTFLILAACCAVGASVLLRYRRKLIIE